MERALALLQVIVRDQVSTTFHAILYLPKVLIGGPQFLIKVLAIMACGRPKLVKRVRAHSTPAQLIHTIFVVLLTT